MRGEEGAGFADLRQVRGADRAGCAIGRLAEVDRAFAAQQNGVFVLQALGGAGALQAHGRRGNGHRAERNEKPGAGRTEPREPPAQAAIDAVDDGTGRDEGGEQPQQAQQIAHDVSGRRLRAARSPR